MAFKFIDNRKKVIQEIEEVKKEALKEIALIIQKRAVYLVPVQTGDLRKSIDYDIKDGFVYVGVLKKGPGAPYAVLVEIGDKGRRPQQYIKPAFMESKKDIERVIEENLKLIGGK